MAAIRRRLVRPCDEQLPVADPYVLTISNAPWDTFTVTPTPRYGTGDLTGEHADRFTVTPEPPLKQPAD